MNRRGRLRSLLFVSTIALSAAFPKVSRAAAATPASTPAPATQESTAKERAESDGRHHIFGFSVGHNMLFGEWGSLFTDGLSYNAFYSYEASPVYGLLFNVGFSSHSGQGENSLSLKSIEPDLKINFMRFDMLVLYGFGGFGIYPISEHVGSANGSTLNFGMNLGLGLDLRIDEFLTFGPGIALKSVFTKNDKSATSSAYPNGINIGGEMLRLFIQIGIMF